MLAVAPRSLEEPIHAIGSGDLFARMRDHAGQLNSLEKIDEAIMSRVLGDEAVKTQLFRFVDTLPALRTHAEMSRHLDEYLQQAGRGAIAAMSHLPGIASIASWQVRRMGRRFIAAENLGEMLAVARELRARRLAITIDVLGEAVVAESEAEQYQREYLELIPTLAKGLAGFPHDAQIDGDADHPVARANASVKLSALYSQFDPIDPIGTTRAVLARLRPILRIAREHGAMINFDMEQFAYKNLTLAIFREVLSESEFREWSDVGIAMQAYLRDTEDDLRALAEWVQNRGTPVWVRLVKGAYWDYETVIAAQNNWRTPVFTDKNETDAAFESATAFLISNRELLRPAIASHNVRSISTAIALAEEAGLSRRAYEFQMLHGMADAIGAALVDLGHRVRIYAPAGKLLPGMAYLVRRLLENTSNQSFLRASFTQHAPEEMLLMNPIFKTTLKSAPPPRATFTNEPLSDFATEEARRGMAEALGRALRRSFR